MAIQAIFCTNCYAGFDIKEIVFFRNRCFNFFLTMYTYLVYVPAKKVKGVTKKGVDKFSMVLFLEAKKYLIRIVCI